MGSWLSVLLLASADGKPSREHGRSFPGDVQISQMLGGWDREPQSMNAFHSVEMC